MAAALITAMRRLTITTTKLVQARVCSVLLHCMWLVSRRSGTMEAIYFGNCSGWGHGQVCVRQWRARACCSMQRVTLLPTGAGAMGHG